MEAKGKLVKKLLVESGVSNAGKTWKKQTCIIDTGADFNNEIAVSAFGDEKLKSLDKLEVGMDVVIFCNVYSREYKGKYYHNIDGYHFTSNTKAESLVADQSDDLPF
jgi:hypothetical protein